MARVKLSATVSGMAGKLNGSQFCNTHYGLCLFNKARQRKYQHALQLPVRSNFQVLAKIWDDLTDAQRAENNANALNYPLTNIFGDTYYLTGYALLLRSNIFLFGADLPLLNVVPFPSAPVITYPLAVTGVLRLINGRVVVIFDYPDGEIDSDLYALQVFFSPAHSAGIINYNGIYFEASVFAFSDDVLQVTSIGSGVAGIYAHGAVFSLKIIFISKNSGVPLNEYFFRVVVP